MKFFECRRAQKRSRYLLGQVGLVANNQWVEGGELDTIIPMNCKDCGNPIYRISVQGTSGFSANYVCCLVCEVAFVPGTIRNGNVADRHDEVSIMDLVHLHLDQQIARAELGS